MGTHDDTRVEGLGVWRREFPEMIEVEVDMGEPAPIILITCKGKPWAAVICPTDQGDYLNVDVHAFSGDAAHKARVLGFPKGTGAQLPNGHDYPLTAVVIGEDA